MVLLLCPISYEQNHWGFKIGCTGKFGQLARQAFFWWLRELKLGKKVCIKWLKDDLPCVRRLTQLWRRCAHTHHTLFIIPDIAQINLDNLINSFEVTGLHGCSYLRANKSISETYAYAILGRRCKIDVSYFSVCRWQYLCKLHKKNFSKITGSLAKSLSLPSRFLIFHFKTLHLSKPVKMPKDQALISSSSNAIRIDNR